MSILPSPRRPRSLGLACAFALLSCAGTHASGGSESRSDAAPVCPTEELRFTQAEGCLNDGSVELCLAVDDEATHAAALALAPTLACTVGSSGRAGCDRARERLCLVPLASADCTHHHGAMTDDAWRRVCALAALPGIRAIVPTWYE